ncbi:hypothetical protein NFIA_018670 [Paecilomyces variotii No. 5]|uniref:Mediator complex subunit 15 KIX domain-containing protein n=1 Tax=Byssochlamys spectabilis (strain No. 5 / NBRC 109023) TaxID=1356009 RepID=V5G6K1_BYSSN|nr:hypothetical protein NFIA_018670 [Paecilomyces variotii No. 5]
MNPASFSNVGAGMPGAGKPPGQMPVPQKNENTQMILKHVAQALQSQGPFTGWRAEGPIQERAVKVYQMFQPSTSPVRSTTVSRILDFAAHAPTSLASFCSCLITDYLSITRITSLRLIQPRIELQSAVQAALSFEEKAFRDAREKVDYEKECTDKLVHIRDTRARQAAVMQGGMMQQAGAGPGMAGVRQNLMQPGFPPQMNRPMQASPMQVQQQMAMGMNDPNQQAAMQQQQQQRQQQSQQAFMQQQAQQRQGTGVPLRDDLNMLSPQEFEQVCRLANQMLLKTSPEDMEKIKMNLQNMTQEQRQYLARKNIEPMTYFFRSQALRELRRHKRNRLEMARAQNGGVDPNSGMMADTMMNANPQQRQMVQNMIGLQRNSAIPMNAQQNPLDPASFIGNVENIQGQQADGLRSQEAGQLVVPASSSQMNPQQFAGTQGMFPGGQQLGQNGQPNTNRSMNPHFLAQQQHLQNAQNVQQERIQQAAQFQAHSQAQSQAQAHARAQAAQKAQMAMSQAGQANPQIPQTMAQPSPAMPMLNRPLGPQMSPVQVGAQPRPQSRAPGMGQQPPGVQSMPGQPAMQNRPQIPPGLPPAVQEQLSQMPPEQINAFLMNHRRNQAMARANAAQQSMSMQPNLSHTGQTPQMSNSQMANDPNMRAAMGLQQQLSGMGGAQPQNQMLPGQQMSLQQRQQQQQNELQKLQFLRTQNGGMDMTPEQIREMDRWPFPPTILNSNNMNSPVPKNVKTWGQLKQWAAQNPHLLGGVDLPKLLTLQRLHLAQTLTQGRDANRNTEQGAQAHGMSMANFPGSQQPFMAPQNFQPGQQQQPPFNMAAAMRPITANDVQIARQRLGAQAQNYTDEQLRELLHRNRQKHIMTAQNRAAAQAFAQQQALNQGQPAQQPQQQPASAPQTTPQMKQQQPVPQQTPQANAKSQATSAAKNVKASPAKAASKKRPSTDEVTVVPPPKAQPVSQPPAPQAPPATARPNITREQLAAMTPQQRAQLEAQMRRQTRAPITKAVAEEAWSHLPEKLRLLYAEISKNAPPPEPVNIPPEQKALMAQQLRESTDMLGRMDTLVQWFAKIPGQEKYVRSLLGMRIQLMRQFKDPDWTINDQFTISLETLTQTINQIKKLFTAMITKVQSQPGAQRAAQQGAAATTSATQPATQAKSALNATNLQQLQQQEEALQRARRASNQSVPPAPTAPQAPFALGAPSPQGVPQAYGPGGLTPDKLKLPPTKKRKQSHGTTPGTPAQGQAATAASKAQGAKQTPADINKAAGLVGSFKCAETECEYHQKGFMTQAALDKHVDESHKVEQIGDPLEFALESFRTVLSQDKVKSGAQESNVSAAAPDMQRAVSKPGIAGLKQDIKGDGATPATIGTTPMGRVSSQIGPKSTSPASNQLQTPRTVSGKPTAGKPTGGKEERKEGGKTSVQVPSPEDATAKDPWADSTISLEAIHDTFMDFGDDSLHGLGFDPLEEFLNADAFGTNLAEDTPDSVETAAVTQTPKDAEPSKDVDVKIGGVSDDNWIPSDWINLPSHVEGEMDLLMSDRWEDLNWDTVDHKDTDLTFDSGPMDLYAL